MVDEGGCTAENGSEGGDTDMGMVAEGGCIELGFRLGDVGVASKEG